MTHILCGMHGHGGRSKSVGQGLDAVVDTVVACADCKQRLQAAAYSLQARVLLASVFGSCLVKLTSWCDSCLAGLIRFDHLVEFLQLAAGLCHVICSTRS